MSLIFYTPKQSAQSLDGYHPSLNKPELLIEHWQQKGFPLQIIKPNKATIEQISLAHDRKFALEILTGQRENGFYNKDLNIARSLIWTTGSFITAATYAYEHQTMTCSPTSGFHHAGYKHADGYCTFNGLVIATLVLQKKFDKIKIGILDFDMHYADGTDELIQHHEIKNLVHYTFGAHFKKGEAEYFWPKLEDILEKFSDCDIVLYQAGADPHINDPLGGVFSTQELYLRDKNVFDYFLNKKIPLCWNLAGGYQKPIEKVLEIHTNTLRAQIEMQIKHSKPSFAQAA